MNPWHRARRQFFMPLLFTQLLLITGALTAEPSKPMANYDESLVPSYTLPDPLVCVDGTKVTDAKTWREKRRPEILELFKEQVYGRSPAPPAELKMEVTSIESGALQGIATRKQITVYLAGEKSGPQMHLLLYVPNAVRKPIPVFLGMNFDGNHTIHSDPGIIITPQWQWDAKQLSDNLVQPEKKTRGQNMRRWPVETILSRGYALATIPRADIEPDYATGWKHGLRGYFLQKSGRSEFAADDWGAIAAWAWGLSRALDALEADPDLDARRVALLGHSRLGKAALWAGAQDERFAIVISNNSGEGGAALARRRFGETTSIINTSFPHWFCGNFKQYNDHEDRMPTDQHELLALIAPRPLYVASAAEDNWADPRGEFLAASHAEPVYLLLGKQGLGTNQMPAVNQPIGDFIGYHRRTGRHDVTEYDWQQYLAFADRHLRSKKPAP